MLQRGGFLLLFGFLYVSCIKMPKGSPFINPKGATVYERVVTPPGYTRVSETKGSFAEYLRNLKLKPDGAVVHFYDGRVKKNNDVYVAVVDMPIGHTDLQQCADVIMHLRAEYLYAQHQEDKIHFTFLGGFRADYTKWRDGYRIATEGGRYKWVKSNAPDNSYEGFCSYMDMIYYRCGSLSLSKELTDVEYKDIKPGDCTDNGWLARARGASAGCGYE